jgi:hypothetical protein
VSGASAGDWWCLLNWLQLQLGHDGMSLGGCVLGRRRRVRLARERTGIQAFESGAAKSIIVRHLSMVG